MKKLLFVSFILILLGLALSACASDAAACPAGAKGISITDLRMEPSTGGSTAAFMVISNCGAEADRLLSVSSDAAAMIQLHKSETRNGVSMMALMDAIDVPAGKQVVLKAGDLHVMFMRLKNELKVGDTVNLTLVFEKAGEMPLQAPVKAP